MPQRPPNRPFIQKPNRPTLFTSPGQPRKTPSEIAETTQNVPKVSNGGAFSIAVVGGGNSNAPTPVPTPPSETLAGDVVGPASANAIASLMGVPFLGAPSVGQAWYIGSGGQYVPVTLFLNPMTTAGDMIVGGSGGAPTRVPIGSNTYVWTSNGTTASWAAISSSLGILDHIVTDSGEVVVDNLTGNVVYV